MKIEIEFEFMKMITMSSIELDDSLTLSQVQGSVLGTLWLELFSRIEKGSITNSDVIIEGRGIRILSDDALKEHLKTNSVFRAYIR